MVRLWTEFNSLRTGPEAGPFEHGNETLDCIKGRKFLDPLSDIQLGEGLYFHTVTSPSIISDCSSSEIQHPVNIQQNVIVLMGRLH
jgi:hypothetical protein